MRKLTCTLIVAVAVAGMAAAPASAARKSHHYTSTVVSATLSTAKSYPAVGGTAVFTGTVKSSAFGDGLLVDRVTITGQPRSGVIAFKGTEVDFLAGGSVRSTFTGTATVHEDGAQTVALKGRFTGGTGRYKGATGSYRFGGRAPGETRVLSGYGKGSLVF